VGVRSIAILLILILGGLALVVYGAQWVEPACASRSENGERRPIGIAPAPDPAAPAELGRRADGATAWYQRDWWVSFICDMKIGDVAIAYFTYCLVVVGVFLLAVFADQARGMRETVDAMRDIARDLSRDMGGSIALAARATGAMEQVAKQVEVSAEAAKRSANAAGRSLVDLERPHLFLAVRENNFAEFLSEAAETVHLDRVEPPTVACCFKNFGKTPAVLSSLTICYWPFASAPEEAEAQPVGLPDRYVIGVDESTETYRCTIPREWLTTDNLSHLRQPGGTRFWFFGKVAYTGPFSDTLYEEEWLWAIDSATQQFRPHDEAGKHRNRHT
jgi:hypothetical protein